MIVSKIVKRVSLGLGIVAGVLTVCAFGVGIFTLQSDMADVKADLQTLDILVQGASSAAHEKELQCKDMVHSFNAMKMKYKYCEKAHAH